MLDMSGRHPAACPALAAPHLEASAVSSATLVLPSMPPAAGQLRRAVHPGLGVAAVAGPGRHARLRAVPGRPGAARVAVLPAGAGALGRGQGGAADAARHGRGVWGGGGWCVRVRVRVCVCVRACQGARAGARRGQLDVARLPGLPTCVTLCDAARSCEPMVTLTGLHKKSAASLLQRGQGRWRGGGRGRDGDEGWWDGHQKRGKGPPGRAH